MTKKKKPIKTNKRKGVITTADAITKDIIKDLTPVPCKLCGEPDGNKKHECVRHVGTTDVMDEDTKPLSAKAQAFVREYPLDFNATQAAIRAGYAVQAAPQQASRLLTKANVQAALAVWEDNRAEEVTIGREYVINGIKETVERCRQHRPVLNRDGSPVMVENEITGEMTPCYTFDAANCMKGYTELGKLDGLYEKDNAQQNSGINIEKIQVVFVDAKGGVRS